MDLPSPIRTLVVDDHAPFRAWLVAFLCSLPRVNVVGEAANGFEAIGNSTALVPDLVIMDIAMPELDGISALQQIARLPHRPRIIMLTLTPDPEYQGAAAEMGADAFIGKAACRTTLPLLIETLFPVPV